MSHKLLKMSRKIAICLLRNDLRYHDNEVLFRAHNSADFILPLYIFDKFHYQGTYHYNFPKTGAIRVKFLLESVGDLRLILQKRGSNLMVAHGHPEEILAKIMKTFHQDNITLICQAEVTKEETDVEKKLGLLCQDFKASFIKIWGSTLYHKSDLPFPIGRLPNNYTGFRKEVEAKCTIRSEFKMPETLKPPPQFNSELSWGTLPSYEELNSTEPRVDSRSAFPFAGGETEALKRLDSYLWKSNAVAQYKATRNGLIGTEYSTKFSPWLALGCLSPRTVYWQIQKYEQERTKNDSTYWVIFEMIWRDYFKFVCLKFGDRIFYPSGLKGKPIVWKKDMQLFEKWRTGRTGVPFVDANMRELLKTGWMSNRGRQNVASFLVKDLNLDWRLGAEWFESVLVDHDVCSNYGNWNYVAGIGNDPREDRKFNMVKQAMDYDADGHYVRLWVEELKNVTGSRIHMPWTLNRSDLERFGVSLGQDYPQPVLIAPEWNRHSSKSGRPNPTGLKSAPPKSGQQRGIDFYFKGKAGEK